ncbi:cyclic nucleotide-gated cation channel beta-3 [Trichinella spiralis]|uniref:cyclic nucleotide-gated cation channel beta-3 n=1 Tax=Trichinella spiralis TaxID=6334 RepID=UPI0001EFEA7A|nr:cyclic nucleotide-gated cation channel beta-3 [Trichinella spiralis]
MKQGVVQASVCQLNYPNWDDNAPNGGGRQYLLWLAFVTLCFAYNAIVIPLRCSFFVQDASNSFYWFVFDYLCDLVYILDMVLVKCRLQVVQSGITITDLPTLRKHYLKSWLFKTDLLSLLPLDLLYILPSLRFKSTLRLPRMLKNWKIVQLCCLHDPLQRLHILFAFILDRHWKQCIPVRRLRQCLFEISDERNRMHLHDLLLDDGHVRFCHATWSDLRYHLYGEQNSRRIQARDGFGNSTVQTECEKGLLRDLVLKLQSVVYLPGDFVCRKNEVGREMYIVSKGVLLVYGGVDGNQLLSTLHEGSVFGEIR